MLSELQGRRFIVRHGMGGHESECCINVEGFSLNGDFIPTCLSDVLAKGLSLVVDESAVMNRGSRIEVWDPLNLHSDRIIGLLEDLGMVNDPEGNFYREAQ